MGCLARLGCLVVLLLLIPIAWLTRDRWLPERYRHHAPVEHGPVYQTLSDAGANRTQAALAKLSQPRGQAFQTLSGADVASYVFRQLAHALPPSADSIQAAVDDDRLVVRASVRLDDLGGAKALGPLAAMFGDRERVELSGTLRVVSSGLAEFQVSSAKIGRVALPHAMIPNLVSRFDRAPRPAGIDRDALPLPIPPYVGDIRVANGRITLYKTAG